METLITSKTRKGQAACIGGLVISNNRLIRLLNPGNLDQYPDSDFKVGDVWNINFLERADIEPPHTEDVIIQSKVYVRKIESISKFIINSGIFIYKGDPNQIFNGRLGWTRYGSGYIERKDNLPLNSVGFWISNQNFILVDDTKHYKYESNNHFIGLRRFPYVGFEQIIDIIPAGTLMRVSLARWWKPNEVDMNKRCYLQLSGWYGLTSS